MHLAHFASGGVYHIPRVWRRFKCHFSDESLGTTTLAEACKGQRLFLRYKRFVFDETKKMVQ